MPLTVRGVHELARRAGVLDYDAQLLYANLRPNLQSRNNQVNLRLVRAILRQSWHQINVMVRYRYQFVHLKAHPHTRPGSLSEQLQKFPWP